MPGMAFFSWPRPHVADFLRKGTNILFIPYAAVTFSYDEYESVVKKAFDEMGFTIKSIHHEKEPLRALMDAEAIAIGGGNTFALIDRLYKYEVLGAIGDRVRSGIPYIGWSAGANVACPTVMTTNDMPVVQPPSFDALELVPFQINPHYTEYKQPGHGGETRVQRIQEFLEMNRSRTVVGLPEGTLLRKDDNNLSLKGEGTIKVFRYGQPIKELTSGDDINFLLV